MADDLMTGENQGEPGAEQGAAAASGADTTQNEGQNAAGTGADESAQNQGADASKDGDNAEGEKPEGAPEEYGDFTLPDGMPEGMQIDQDMLNEFKPLAKELGLSQEKAQKLVDLQAVAVKRQTEAAIKFYENRDSDWTADLKADKEVGGDALGANAVKVNRFLQTFDKGGEMVKFMADNRLQNCAPLFKMLARASAHFSEDVLVGGNDKTGKGDKPSYMRMGYKPVDEY